MNLQNDLEPAGEQMTLFSLAGSRNYASHTAQQEKDSEKMTNATFGQKCLEQYERLNPHGSWAKMFSDLLIGMVGWYSKRCKLTWRLKGTKYNRTYFQLQVLTLPIEEIEFGLWPTPTSVQRDHPERVEKLKATGAKTMMSRAAGKNRPNSVLDAAMFYELIPTPRANQVNGCNLNSEKLANRNKGNLEETVAKWNQKGMLPTPNASDNRNRGNPNDPCIQKRIENGKQVGLTMMVDGQLNPQFVMEMMGFPPDWTLLPFLSGETKASKPEATPSCHK